MTNPYNAVVSSVQHEVKDSGKLKTWTVALKDNINMKGTFTTASSKILENYQSVYNATVVDKLIEQGANIQYKTSMDELGMGGTNRNAITGPVLNPYDKTRISGGSSGGSAALSAAGIVDLALGSDTGDSVRKPASYCGTVGVKPSYGRISRYGVIPYASSLDHVGYFTQSVEKAALALEVLAGNDPKDMSASTNIVEKYSELLELDLKGKRIAVFKNVVDCIVNPDIKASFDKLLIDLQAKGAEIVFREMDVNLARSMVSVYFVLANGEAVSHHAGYDGVRYGLSVSGETLEDTMTQTRTQGFSDFVKERLIYGQYAIEKNQHLEVFVRAKKVRRLLVESYQEMLEGVDVIIAPATPTVATKIDDVSVDIQSDQYLIGENHMVINNFTGYPSMTLPLGDSEGMPFGVNISAKAFDEKTMFAYAKQIENLVNWKGAF